MALSVGQTRLEQNEHTQKCDDLRYTRQMKPVIFCVRMDTTLEQWWIIAKLISEGIDDLEFNHLSL